MNGNGVQGRMTSATRSAEASRPAFTGRARISYVSALNVYEAAYQRIKWLHEEFDGKISCSMSGGKDSTVVMELALKVRQDLGITEPLTIAFLDQELEFGSTVSYMRRLVERPELNVKWYQIPFKLYNTTSHANPWLNCWGEGEEWSRPKEPDSIHVNTFKTPRGKPINRFTECLEAIHAAQGGAVLTGLRAQESPGRRLGLTTDAGYKWVTWVTKGKRFLPKPAPPKTPTHYQFHVIWDWRFSDVWKFIHDESLDYNEMYDHMFRLGFPENNMRVSNYHHSTATYVLDYLQEIEPEIWEGATRRLAGINAYKHVGAESIPHELPFMFEDWSEYVNHLIDNLYDTEEQREAFRKIHLNALSRVPEHWKVRTEQKVARAVVHNDPYVALEGFLTNVAQQEFRRSGKSNALGRTVKT